MKIIAALGKTFGRALFASFTLASLTAIWVTAPAHALEVDQAQIKLKEPVHGRPGVTRDRFDVTGRIERFALDPFPDLVVSVGPYQELIAASQVVDHDGRLAYHAPKGTAGITGLEVDPFTGDLFIRGSHLDLSGLENPVPVRLLTATDEECVLLEFGVQPAPPSSSQNETWHFKAHKNRYRPCIVGMPDVTGLPLASALTVIDDALMPLGAIVVESDHDMPAGLVLVQSPQAGAEVSSGGPVNLVVSSGREADVDGVDPLVEDGAPNGGDGNGDGIPDSEQARVASLPNSEDGRYLTLISPAGTILRNVTLSSGMSVGSVPADTSFPVGLAGFQVEGLSPGGGTTVTVLLPDDVAISNYHRFGPTAADPAPHWYEFLYDGETGAEFFRDRVVLHFKDGARGDDDLDATNGVIVDPGGASRGACGFARVFTLTARQAFGCTLPLVGGGQNTWQLVNGAGTASRLPSGLELVEEAGRWHIAGVVADDASLATFPMLLRGTSATDVVDWEVTIVVDVPFTLWTQNTLLRMNDLIPPEIILNTCVAALLFPPLVIACGELIRAELDYDAKVLNTWADNRERSQLILSKAEQFDLVSLQEVFGTVVDNERLEWIVDGASQHWVLTGPGPTSVGLPPHASSGLALLVGRNLSPPLTQVFDLALHERHVFDTCHDDTADCLSEKGFTLDRVHIGPNPQHYFWLINTHTQANEPPIFAVEERLAQLRQIQTRIETLVDADPNHPVLIMGDFNIDQQADDPTDYIRMLDRLDLEPVADLLTTLEPPERRLTFDPARNPYAFHWFPEDEKAQQLDYMLVRQGRRFGIEVRSIGITDENIVTNICATQDWPSDSGPDGCYLSDHYGIAATLGLFSTAPEVTIVRPAQGDTLIEGQSVVLHATPGGRIDLIDQFEWTSDRLGRIAGPRNSTSWTAALPGAHTITATVTDFDGLMYSDSVDVVVAADRDGDGLTDTDEIEIYGTDPDDPDTDGDGLRDGAEVNVHFTDPTLADTDGDGLSDSVEIALGSNPRIGDSDQDGLPDGSELSLGTSPAMADSDGDGVWDGAELVLNTLAADPASTPAGIPDGMLFGANGAFLVVIDPSDWSLGRLGQPAGGFGFSLAADDAGVVFIGDFFENRLAIADPLTAVPTEVGPLATTGGEFLDPLSMAFNPADGYLYSAEEGTPCAAEVCPLTGQLLRIERSTGVVTRVGAEGPDPVRTLAFDATGRLFAIAVREDVDWLVELDPATGANVQNIGPTGLPLPVFGLVFDANGNLFGTVPRTTGYETNIVSLDLATGAAAQIETLDVRVLDLGLTRARAVGAGVVEDFSDDGNPSNAGFASSLFMHSLLPSEIVDETFFPTLAPYPSSPHALALFVDPDVVSFNLGAGERIARASVMGNAFFGFGFMEVVGTTDSRTLNLLSGVVWQLLEVRSSDIGDGGLPVGDILQVTLSGGEVLFDDLRVEVVQ